MIARVSLLVLGMGLLPGCGSFGKTKMDPGVPTGLNAIGVDPADFDTFAQNALRDTYIATNPRPVSEDDVRRICSAAY